MPKPKPTGVHRVECPYPRCRWSLNSLFEHRATQQREIHVATCQYRPTSAPRGTSVTN
jgi:hypothetical protein